MGYVERFRRKGKGCKIRLTFQIPTQKVEGDKEVMVLKPDFQFMLRKKFSKYASITRIFLLA